MRSNARGRRRSCRARKGSAVPPRFRLPCVGLKAARTNGKATAMGDPVCAWLPMKGPTAACGVLTIRGARTASGPGAAFAPCGSSVPACAGALLPYAGAHLGGFGTQFAVKATKNPSLYLSVFRIIWNDFIPLKIVLSP
jgi:hypothetical protein